MTKEGIGAILKQLRIDAGMTQKEVAQKIGRTQQIVGHWETGYSQPDANTLFVLCAIYGTSVDHAFGFNKNSTNITKSDRELLKKYHILDNHGQRIVDFILNEEYTRCTSQPEEIEEESAIYQIRPMQLSEQPASAGRGTYLGPESFHTIMVQKNDLTDRTLFAVPVSGNSMEPTYYNGDILLVEKTEELQEGEIGIFTLDGEGYVKKLGDGELISLNPDYAPIPMNESILLNGKVIGILEDEWIVER